MAGWSSSVAGGHQFRALSRIPGRVPTGVKVTKGGTVEKAFCFSSKTPPCCFPATVGSSYVRFGLLRRPLCGQSWAPDARISGRRADEGICPDPPGPCPGHRARAHTHVLDCEETGDGGTAATNML